MNHEEFAFFNQQLAGMLRAGIPLEGALRKLCAEMRRGPLRAKIEKLEADLARGTPLADAIAARKLPEFYVRLVQAGVKAGDLPGTLVLLADHYQAAANLWTRLKGLLVYPAIVVAGSLGLSLLLNQLGRQMINMFFTTDEVFGGMDINARMAAIHLGLWAPPILLLLAAGLMLAALLSPGLRRKLSWRVPGFREANLSQTAATLDLMIRRGCTASDAIAMLAAAERGCPAGAELSVWQQRLAEGRGRFAEFAAGGRIFPPLFTWMVSSAGEDLAGGFRRAAEFYRTRALARIERMLYAVLPVSVLALGLMLLSQLFVGFQAISLFVQTLSQFD